MDFTPANDGNNSGLDDLKKNVIDANLKQPDVSEESVSSGLDALDDAVESDNHTFSMNGVSLPDTPTLDSPVEGDAIVAEADSSDTISVDSILGEIADDHVEAVITNPNAGGDDADLSKITIEEKDKHLSGSPSFSFEDEEEVKEPSLTEKVQKILHLNISSHSLTWYIVSGIVFLLAILGSFYFYYAERYVYYNTQPFDSLDETAKTVLERVDSYRNVLQIIGLVDSIELPSYMFVSTDTDNDMLQNILSDESVGYVEKYDHFHSYLNLLDRRIPELYQTVLKSREELASYPFFPDLLQNIINPDDDSSLQRSLLSLEGVKFRTAIAVFSKFDTFVRQFALTTGRDEESVRAFLDIIMNRGDVDIDYYLSTCYLNPYENPDTCSSYGDFSRVYDFYEGGDVTVDTVLFAQMMGFIDDKLENSVLPSLSLSTRDFDPISQQLTLVIDVNTLPDDTLQLLSQNILSPHIYVVGNMINFLRQSKFIVSEDINISELQINKVIVPVGSKDVTVSTSHFEFTLPLQKNTQREITDYFVVNEGYDSGYFDDSYLDVEQGSNFSTDSDEDAIEESNGNFIGDEFIPAGDGFIPAGLDFPGLIGSGSGLDSLSSTGTLDSLGTGSSVDVGSGTSTDAVN